MTSNQRFMGALLVLVMSLTVASSLFQSPKRAQGGDNAPPSCNQNCRGGGNARMARCLRFECRKHVFRYFMRIGKRRNKQDGVPSTHADGGLMGVLQPRFHKFNEQNIIKVQQQPRENNRDDALAQKVLRESLGLDRGERQRIERLILLRLLGRKAHFLQQRTPSLQAIKNDILQTICYNNYNHSVGSASSSSASSSSSPSFTSPPSSSDSTLARLCKLAGFLDKTVGFSEGDRDGSEYDQSLADLLIDEK